MVACVYKWPDIYKMVTVTLYNIKEIPSFSEFGRYLLFQGHSRTYCPTITHLFCATVHNYMDVLCVVTHIVGSFLLSWLANLTVRVSLPSYINLR